MKKEELIRKAQEALTNPLNSIFIRDNAIPAYYSSQMAAFGVTIAMSGLLPALAMYYQSVNDNAKCNRKKILELIASMLRYPSVRDLFADALKDKPEYPHNLKHDIIACSVALKQVIRTYELIDEEDE